VLQSHEELISAGTGPAGGNFMSRLLHRLEGAATVPMLHHAQGSKQLLARKWWECGGNACDKPPSPPGPSHVGIHMGEMDTFRKKNCRTAKCFYANSATGFNVPGTGKTGHRWGADGELDKGGVRANVGDRYTTYGGRGAPWKGYDKYNTDARVVQERVLGTHEIRGGAPVDLYRGGVCLLCVCLFLCLCLVALAFVIAIAVTVTIAVAVAVSVSVSIFVSIPVSISVSVPVSVSVSGLCLCLCL